MATDHLKKILAAALEARREMIDSDHLAAVRLFNGFYEGFPDLVVDIYGRTLVLFGYSRPAEAASQLLNEVQPFLLTGLPFVDCVIQKIRSAPNPVLRRGRVTFGVCPARQVYEHGTWYALDLLMNQDASLYLDTRELRGWLLAHATGWELLNLFAYTGSLGIAALCGGAARVIQVDHSRKFLDLAAHSAALNLVEPGRLTLCVADFFSQVAYFKRRGTLFDCVLVDPPFFSTTHKGAVDLGSESQRVINKVRPLARDGGRLVVVNNALFLSGAEYMQILEKLCVDGYLAIEKLIPVPEDVTGYPHTVVTKPPKDPAPFNHATKIAVLSVQRK